MLPSSLGGFGSIGEGAGSSLPASRHCCVRYQHRKTIPCFYGQCELSSVVPAEPVRSPAAFPVSLLAFLGAVEGI